MHRTLIYLFVLCFFIIPFCSKGSVKDTIKKTYVIVHYGWACVGESDIIVKGKYRIKEVCGGCCFGRNDKRRNKRTKRIVKIKFGLDY